MPLVVLLTACAPWVEFRGTSRPPHPAGELGVYERAPDREHRVVGWVITDGAFTLDEHLGAARDEAAKRGCDALVLNPNHRIVRGVISDDATGIWTGFRAQVTGLRAACIAWTAPPS